MRLALRRRNKVTSRCSRHGARVCDWITRVSDARTVPADRAGLTVRDARVREREHLVPLPEHPFDAEVVVPIASGKTPYLRFERDPQ